MSSEQAVSQGERTYAETVARGFYSRNVGGLFGKYDNVRACWEDQLTRVVLRPFVRERVETCEKAGRGVRIVDLGCGAGQGFELLTTIDRRDRDLHDEHRYVLRPEQIQVFQGLDLSDAMVMQGRENYRALPQVKFDVADLREGLGPARKQDPFDIYFSSYGALSHLDTDGLRRCVSDVATHGREGAIMVLDLLGRYSPEWPGYWSAKEDRDKVRPYSMSYLYPEAERKSGTVEQFPIRFWTGAEVRELAAQISEERGVHIEVAQLLDRSIFVGRHIDTREYGTSLPPLRGLVNRLHEQNVRTPLASLRVSFRDVEGHADLNRFFQNLATCWNVVVDFANDKLHGANTDLVDLPGWRDFPAPLQMALMTIDRIVDSVAWIDVGDVRANIIEPQLGYVLRTMQHQLQEGRGCGHGLVAVLRVGGPLGSKRSAAKA